MPFNKQFREMKKRLKEIEKDQKQKSHQKTLNEDEDVDIDIDEDKHFPEHDIHCEGMTIHGKGKLDKYGNYTEE